MKGVKLEENNKVKTLKTIQKYIKPQIIYIPLESKTGVIYKHLVKEGDYVYKGDVVAINEEIDFPIHASVSGYVIAGTMKIMNNGKKIKCIVVENDFKERYREKAGAKRDISKYSKKEFIKMLQKFGITGLGGSDFPTFIKYNEKTKYLIVNGVECEPYISCDKAIISEYTEDLLEAIDAIVEIMELKIAYIAVKEDDFKSINAFTKYIGSYPKIKLYGMPNEYPSGWERNIISSIFNKSYKNYPEEIGIVVNNVSTIYAIYEMLKYNRPLTERIITITGDGLNKPTNVKVKIGAAVSEIINYIEGYKKIDDLLFIAGGPMMGKSLPTDEIVITKDLNCVLVLKDKEHKKYPCIRCGKCANVCPVNILPVEIMNHIKNTKMLKKLKPERCIECGLCSYICPSKIEVRECVKIAKEKGDNDEGI